MDDILGTLQAIEERLTAMETQKEADAPLTPAESDMLDLLRVIQSRGTPDQWQQLFNDMMHTYGLVGQMAEVITQQREQIQAFAEAMHRFHELLSKHDAASTEERGEIYMLMVQLRELARDIVRKVSDVGKAVGVDLTPRERAARDVRPEEGGADDLPSERKRRKGNPAA